MATNSEKFENLLNLALDATGREREKSLQLGVGYEPEGERWELIVKYSGNIMRLAEENPQIQVTELMNEYAIINTPENALEQISNAPEVEYVEKPKRLYFAVREGKQASCITPLQGASYALTGKDVILAVLDSGIDYSHPDFRNRDGSTRILAMYDETLAREFTSEEINRALEAPTEQERFRIVPSRDTSGHVTHVTGIEAGNGNASNGTYDHSLSLSQRSRQSTDNHHGEDHCRNGNESIDCAIQSIVTCYNAEHNDGHRAGLGAACQLIRGSRHHQHLNSTVVLQRIPIILQSNQDRLAGSKELTAILGRNGDYCNRCENGAAYCNQHPHFMEKPSIIHRPVFNSQLGGHNAHDGKKKRIIGGIKNCKKRPLLGIIGQTALSRLGHHALEGVTHVIKH